MTTVIADNLPFRQCVKNITDYLEKEQVDQVLGAAHKCSQRDYLMLRVLWRTGVRLNELLTITPRDIEPQNSVVNVTKAKGGKQRRVHLDAETIKMLSEYVPAQELHDDRPVSRSTQIIDELLSENKENYTIPYSEITQLRVTAWCVT